MSTKPENKSTTLLRRIVARIDDDRMIMDVIVAVRLHLKTLDANKAVAVALEAVAAAPDKLTTLEALDRVTTTVTYARDLAIENQAGPDDILSYQLLLTIAAKAHAGILGATEDDVKLRAAVINVMHGEALGQTVRPESFDIIADALAKEILTETDADRVDAALRSGAYRDVVENENGKTTMPNFRDPLARRVPRFADADLRAGKGFGQPIGKDGLARA